MTSSKPKSSCTVVDTIALILYAVVLLPVFVLTGSLLVHLAVFPRSHPPPDKTIPVLIAGIGLILFAIHKLAAMTFAIAKKRRSHREQANTSLPDSL